MGYDHGRKAGNQGDVWKHAVLSAVARLIAVNSHFRYIETHAGGPTHRLRSAGEWRRGIGKVLEAAGHTEHSYLVLARSYIKDGVYPAGWCYFADIIGSRVRRLSIDLCDTSVEVARQYECLPEDYTPENIKEVFRCVDGFSYARTADADLVFIDPPYSPKADEDWWSLTRTCQELRKRGIPYLAWYPIYWPTRPDHLISQTCESGIEVMWSEFGNKPSQNMKGCGMLASKELMEMLGSKRAQLDEIAELLGCINGISIRS